jgi:phage-related minor tail protein
MERVVAIKITSDGKAFVVDQAANAAAVKQLGDQVKSTNDEIARQNAAMAETSRKVTAGLQDQGYAAKVLAEQELTAADATDKFMFKLQQQAAEAGKTKAELLALRAAQHGVAAEAAPFISAIDAATSSHGKFSLASAGATRELLVLGNEMANGRWTRFGGSMNVLAQQTGAVSLLMTPLGAAAIAAAAGVGVLAVAAFKAGEEAKRLNGIMVETNGYAELTADRFNKASESIATAAKVGIGTGREALMDLASTGRITGDTLDLLAKNAVRTAELTGEKLSDIAKDYAKMADGVAKWAEEHNKSMHFMGLAQYEHIKALEEQGKKQAAMIEVGKLLDAQLDQQAPRLGLLSRAWHALGVTASNTWDAILGVGRPTTVGEKVDAASQAVNDARVKIERLQQLPSGSKDTQLAMLQAQKDLQNALFQQSVAQDSALESKRQASHKAEMARVNEEGIAAVDRINKQILSYDKVASVQKQLDAARRDFDAAAAAGHAVSAKDQQTIIDGIQAQIKARKESVDGVNAEIEAVKRADMVKQAEAKQQVADIESLVKQGVVSKLEGIRQIEAAELAAVDAHEAALKRELAIAKTKANSQTEQVRLEGEIAKAAVERAKVVSDANNATAEVESKMWADSQKGYENDLAARQAQIDKIGEQVSVIQQEIDTHGKSALAIQQVTLAREQEQARRLESLELYGPYLDKLREEIAARQQLIGVMQSKALQDANDQAAKKAEEAWQHADRSIEEGLYSALANGAESGRKKIEHDLKDWALHFVLQIPVSLIGQAGASLLNPGAASAGGGYGNLLSAATGGNNIIGSVGNAFMAGYGGSGAGLGAASAFEAGGAASGAFGVGGGLGGASGAAELAGTGAAVGADAAVGAAAVEGGAAAGSIGAGATAALGAIPVVGWIALAGLALYSIFGGKGGGPKTEGGYAPGGVDISGIDIGGSVQGSQRGNVADAKQLSDAISTGLTGLGNEFGVTLAQNIGVFFAKDPQGDSMTQLQVVSDNYNRSQTEGGIENVGRSDAEFQAALAKATAQLDLTELAHALTGKIGDYLKALDPASLTTEQIASYIQIAANAKAMYNAFEQLGPAFKSTADMTVTGMNDLVTAMGGIQTATAQLADYDKNYYTATEQRGQIINNIVKTLGAAGMSFTADQVANATRNQFRALVESLDLTTDAGKKDFAALMSVEGALASVTAAATDTSMGLTTMHDQMLADIDSAAKALADARAAETKTISDQITALRSSSEQFHTFANDLRAFRDNLLLGSLSPLTPAQKYAEAQQQFEQTYQAAMSGDPAALAKLQQASTDFLQASQIYNASSAAYQHDFAEVQAALTLAATKSDAQATSADAQLVVLNAQLSATEQVNASVLTVAQAIDNLAQAVSAAIGAGLNPGSANVGALTNGVTGQFVNTAAGSAYSSPAGAAALNGTIYAINGGSYTFDQARQYLGGLVAAGEPMEAYYAIKSAGITLAEADKLMGWSAMTAENWATANGLPIFHQGTNFVQKTGLALLEQGEAVVPRAFNPSALNLGGGNALLARVDELVASNKALAAEVRSVKAQVANSAQEQIAHNYQANHQAAATVVNGTANAASRDAFVQRQADSARALA